MNKMHIHMALAGVGQWIVCQPENQRVASSIPNQDTGLGSQPGPDLGENEGEPHSDVSLPILVLPYSLFKNK